jgi:hypothetical protein
MELEIYDAFRSAGVADDKARAAVESINQAIDKRYEIHSRQLATRGDMAEMESRLLKAINDAQRWTMGAVFAGMAAVAAIIKLF